MKYEREGVISGDICHLKGNIGRGKIDLEGERMSSVLNESAVEVELSSSQLNMCLMLIREVWATV